MQINLNLKTLKALSKHVAAKKDVRYYLNGVAVQHEVDARYLVATDGVVIVAVREEYPEIDARDVPSFIIPRDFLDDIKIRKFGQDAVPVEIEIRPENVPVLNFPTLGRTCLAIDGTFPKWRNAVPAVTPSAVPARLDPEMVARVDACYRAVTGARNAGTLFYTGAESPALYVGSDCQFLGLIAAMRGNEWHFVPNWTPNQPRDVAQAA